MRRIGIFLKVFLLVGLLICGVSCKRSEEGGQASLSLSAPAELGLLKSELLAKLPAGTVGFLVWDSTSDAAKKFRVSPWGSNAGIMASLDALKSIDSKGALQGLDKFQSILKKAGLGENAADPAVKEGVVYLSLDKGSSKPSAGFLASAADGVDLKAKLGALTAAFESEGFKSEKQDLQGQEAYKMALPAEVAQVPGLESVLATSNGKYLAISSSQEDVTRLFAQAGGDTMAELKKSPEFQKTLAKLPGSKEQLVLGYLDFTRAVESLKSFPLIGAQAGPALDQMPVGSLAYTRNMGAAPYDTFNLSVNPKSEEQKRWLGMFQASGKQVVADSVPQNLMFALALDGNVLNGAKDAALAAAPAEEIAPYQDLIAKVSSIEGLTIAGREGAAGSPFPDLAISIQSSQAPELLAALKEEVKKGMIASGMPAAQWQEKDVAGVKASYAITPLLGLGIYLANSERSVFLTSSESCLKDFVEAGKNKTGTLLSSLSPNSKEVLKNPGVFMAYFNMERLASMIHSFQGTLSMFTGGKSNFDTAQIDEMKKLGSVVVALDKDADLVRLRSSFEPPALQTALK